jgi:hypothetical protein
MLTTATTPVGAASLDSHNRTTMNLTFDLLNRCRHPPTKSPGSRVREMARRGRDITRTSRVNRTENRDGSETDSPKCGSILAGLHRSLTEERYCYESRAAGLSKGSDEPQ